MTAHQDSKSHHPSSKLHLLEFWQGEVDSAAQYRALEALESDPARAKIFAGLAAVEEKHQQFWAQKIQQAGYTLPTARPSWRSRFLILAAQKLGPEIILPTLRQLERADRNVYAVQPETQNTSMASEERQHTLTLGKLESVASAGVEGTMIANLEGRHRSVGGNALRAGVLGVNDGLCSNLSLVMGVVGISSDHRVILLTGLAGLFAGACSMALGEWLSVTNSRELAEREIRIERGELNADPAGEKEELKLIYESKGLSSEEARELSKKMISNPDKALDTLVREELGLDPEERGGNPNQAALVSFLLFTMGALIPIFPLFFTTGPLAVVLCILIGAMALFAFGAITTVFTGQPALKAGLRQLILGLFAAGLTFGVGRLIGVSLS